ncbi:amidohydrolase [Brevibacillus choshinensis]|uniref:Amidohydrolase n=1 Tax=Brevibacillus choshinensis TaxID=54911 RepID=A0ABR5MZT7_BRECH|nr:M20 family metallopeptidase [Brevibacillus choshinensis]KQL43618.1 amidohydrolase [Brevibacillus choshinensis]
MDYRHRISEIIEQKRDVFILASDKIWDYAETRHEEYKSAEYLCNTLEAEGFQVEKRAGDIETAFIGSYGSGKPVVAILGEFDALFGLSQKSGSLQKEPIMQDGNGHGCGHNLLGTGALAAAVGLRYYMEENNIPGTVRYYGCPAEEGGGGKGFMARKGLFDDVDFALTWHPADMNMVMSMSFLATNQVYFRFKGKSSHAAASPHLGRSAMDAVELMNVGANYLREHIIQDARLHYAITNTGGFSPNVVQPEAEVLYKIRAPKTPQVEEIYQRVCDIARGAALMTETELEIEFDAGSSNVIPNTTLEEVMHDNFTKLGIPTYDEQEMKFAQNIRTTLTEAEKSHIFLPQLKDKVLADFLASYVPNAGQLYGSSDVGDVSWITPTAQCFVSTSAVGTSPHSWQMVTQGKASIAHKGMLHAGKVIAATAFEIMQNPDLIEKAKTELREILGDSQYVCPIPSYVKPSPIKKGRNVD